VRSTGDNGDRAASGRQPIRAGLRRSAFAAPRPVYHFAFLISKDRSVTTQQFRTASRKPLTLLQLLGIIGAAGLIASILLNLLV
jgi:hypothetical protein